MKMKMTVMAVAAGMAIGAFAATTADYVQDGLLVHLDGIDNENTGTHNASATRWKAIKGSTYVNLQSGASWVDGKYLDTSPAQHILTGMPAYKRASFTVETVVDIIDKGKPAGTTETVYPRIFANGEALSIHYVNNGTAGQFYMSGYDKRPMVNPLTGGTIAVYSGSTRYAISVDGVEKDTSTYPVTETNTRAAVNWTFNGHSGYLHGHYYAFRFYNRMLTAEELKRNHVVDSVRFRGACPDGYRDNPADGRLQRRFRVAAPAGGTVTVDGDPLAADFEEWAALDTEMTHTLTATPAEGYFFQRWEGTTGAITSGTIATRTITVSSMVAVNLTPVFTAIPEPSMAEPVVTINVDSGTTVLDDWLAANPDVTIGASGTIVKTGAGTLQVTNDLISSFAGEFVIRGGRWLADTRTALGVQSGGGVWVEDGATLHLRATEPAEVASQTLTRKAYIKGTGWDGNGALYASNIKGYDDNHQFDYAWPKYITLLDDAKLGIKNHMNLLKLNVDMNRFTLTIRPSCDWTYMDGVWSNGNITVTGTTVVIQSDFTKKEPENTIRFASSSGYCPWAWGSEKNHSSTQWNMELASGSLIYARGGISGWMGPVTLEGDTRVKSQNVWTSIYFWGPISGPGNIGKTSDAGSGWTYTSRGVTIRLANPDNSFSGGIWLKYNILDAYVDGAVPPDGGAVTMDNSTFKLSAATEYHLPDLAISGTGSVYSVAGTTGSFKDVTKTGSALFTWNTKVGAKSFTLGGGTLDFGATAATNGVVKADFGRFTVTNGSTVALGGNSWTCTNLTGAATLVDGTLTVDGPWTLDSAEMGTLGGGTATVAFGPDTVLSLANPAGLNRATTYTIATSAADFAAPVPVDAAARALHWRVRLSADRRSQELFYAGGATLIFR